MNNDNKTAAKKFLSVLVGLAIGQAIIFLAVNPEGWQPVDKAMFGIAIGVGISGLFVAVIGLVSKK